MSLLRLEGIKKSFGAIHALRGVDLNLNHGEVLAIAGDNGAGKSTLMKILSGAVIPDEGQMYFEDERIHLSSPADSRTIGIEMVYQDLSICDTVNVAKNLFLGREPIKHILGVPIIDEQEVHKRARAVLNELEINVPSTHSYVRKLSGGQRQAVAIGRSVLFDPKVLVLDEPTAALAVKEVGKVLELIRLLRQRGVGIILISHRLQDLLEVSDRIMVMYEGTKVADEKTIDTSLEELIRLIVQEKSHSEAS